MPATPAIQPAFVENIVAAVQDKFKNHDDGLIVQRPDYTRLVGVGDNLARTTMQLDQQVDARDLDVVHVSNLEYGDNKDTHVVIFADGAGNTKRTVNYQPPATMLTKEHFVSNIGYRSNVEIHNDIAEYLATGKLPQ